MSNIAIFVINLPVSTDRLQSMQKQLAAVGKEFITIKAVDGSKIADDEFFFYKREVSYAITKGEVGCAMSHLKAYKQLLDSDYDLALILEDDVTVPADIGKHLQSIAENNNRQCNVTLLSDVNHYQSKKLYSTDDNHHVHKVLNAAFSHGYVINKPAAKKMLANLFPIWCVADQWTTFKEFGLIDIHGVVPSLINTYEPLEKVTTIGDRSSELVRQEKKIIWSRIRDSRPVTLKMKKSLWLAFVRPFISIKKEN
ncbi:glycosyltransferase family 25 protein [Erwinia sp. 198]|uniref:glycosyltransferase family 25 protein n=1 Tax=Erwinia sp. 198 TaxID=2022746 RepID=UPI000F66B342|nr:glycosyltransferase family 25 protein [Erwinia sp. 198]RRZ90939.1 glycosyltransferase family 25 protein [Erwinia sp. 198]